MRTRLYILSLTLLIFSGGLWAQRFSPFTLFGLNQTYYNPAANGHQDVLSADFFYRQNWVGVPGAYSTQTFGVHTPLKNPSLALGLLVEHDASGATSTTGLHFSYAYRISFGANRMAFGLRAGMRIVSESIEGRDDFDPAWDVTNMPYYQPNFGFGMLFYAKKYWAGFSVPWIFDYTSDSAAAKYGIHYDPGANEYCLMAGGNINLTPDFGVEPSAFMVYYPADGATFAMNVLGVYKQFYKAGFGFRTGYQAAVSFLLSMNINRQFRLGYSYDLDVGDLDGFSGGSHEINIHYKFGYKVNASNPRGF